jgi:hypothetical protein
MADRVESIPYRTEIVRRTTQFSSRLTLEETYTPGSRQSRGRSAEAPGSAYFILNSTPEPFVFAKKNKYVPFVFPRPT